MKSFFFKTTAVSCILLLGACATKTEKQFGVNQTVLLQNPSSVPAAIEAAKVVLNDYGKGLKGSDRTRRVFNVLGIVAGAYTGIGAGIETAPSNLVFSTALSAALPLLEPNLQSHGSPETIGEAIVKTSCVIRQASDATTSKTLLSVELLREHLRVGGLDTGGIIASTLEGYDGLAPRIVGAYMAVYYNYSVAKVPPALSKSDIETAYSVKPADQETAEEQAEGIIAGTQAAGNKSLGVAGFSMSPAAGTLSPVQVSALIGIVSQATTTAEKQIAECIAAPSVVTPAS